jgi:hypothetical protein
MSFRLVMGALLMNMIVAIAAAGSPALACKGATSLLRDDFTESDPAWLVYFEEGGTFTIGGGKIEAKSDPGSIAVLTYEGDFFPAGDLCITITGPTVRDPTNRFAGILLQAADGAWYMPSLYLDGTAGVSRLNPDGWLNPVPPRKFAGIKTGTNAANVLRVVWKAPPARGSKDAPDPTVSVFINDRHFVNFKMPPNSNRQIGLAVGSEGDVYQFSDLSVTR